MVNKAARAADLRAATAFLLAVAGMLLPISVAASAEEPGTRVGNRAGEFTIARLDGSEFRMADYRGKKAVGLVFWATWCPNCLAEIPTIKAFHANYQNDIELLAINVAINDSVEKIDQYRTEHGVNYPMAFDEEGGVVNQYAVVGTPTILIIDVDGIIRYRGARVPEDIVDHLDMLLGRQAK